MSKLQIIIGSTRPGRAADQVAPWVIGRARAHDGFDVEVLDLRDSPLPIFAEHLGTIGNFDDPAYSTPIVWEWNRKIVEGDAVEAEMVPLRTAVVIHQVADAFHEAGNPVNPVTEVSLEIALDDLKWWSDIREAARVKGQLPPAVFRIRPAAAAVHEVEEEAV